MATFTVHYTDADQRVHIAVEAASAEAALQAAVEQLVASDDWSDTSHSAWIEDEDGGVIAETTFSTEPA